MSFQIEYDRQPTKYLKKCEKPIAKRIMDKMQSVLLNNPIPHDAKAIIGEHGVFRIRIGDYRALCRVNYKERRVIIFKLEKRSKVYD
jgi:mRNA interferase RelE/StbE